MLRPTPEQLAVLGRFERFAFALTDQCNRVPALKRLSQAYLRTVGASWVHYCTRNLMHVEGLDRLAALRPDRGVLLASNHRSFFDLYVVSSVLLRATPWVRELYFPVRGDYFYERPDGILVNALMAAMAMYPPVMREAPKRAFNQYTVDVLAELSQRPGTVVGMHPEGTRNKTDDPYALLPAQPGIGQIVYHARPIVVPTFILGVGNNLPRQVRGNFDGTGDPVTLVIGEPLDLARFYAEPPRLRTYKRLADYIRDEISALGAKEQALRTRLGLPSRVRPAASPEAAVTPSSEHRAA